MYHFSTSSQDRYCAHLLVLGRARQDTGTSEATAAGGGGRQLGEVWAAYCFCMGVMKRTLTEHQANRGAMNTTAAEPRVHVACTEPQAAAAALLATGLVHLVIASPNSVPATFAPRQFDLYLLFYRLGSWWCFWAKPEPGIQEPERRAGAAGTEVCPDTEVNGCMHRTPSFTPIRTVLQLVPSLCCEGERGRTAWKDTWAPKVCAGRRGRRLWPLRHK